MFNFSHQIANATMNIIMTIFAFNFQKQIIFSYILKNIF